MKITEARLRQIIREELAERRKYMSAANHPAFLAGHNEAMKGTPAVDAKAKMPYDEETEEADLFMQGFEQGEHEFGYRMEGKEEMQSLSERVGGGSAYGEAEEAMSPESASRRTVPFRHHSVRSDQVPRGRDAMWEEEDFIKMFPAGIDGMEISDPGMANWSPSVPQIVYLGSCPKYHYYKLSTSPDYFKVDK